MNKLLRGLTLTVAGAALAVAPLQAQGGGTGAFRWYVGAQGGVMSFGTATQDREYIPAAGGHFLITAKRTGLLLSVDQAFGSDETSLSFYQVVDGQTGAVLDQGVQPWTFQGIRKYSAVLLAYPVRNRTVQPFLGLGGGILHLTTTSPGPFASGVIEDELGTSAFGTAVAGIEFRVGPVSAFGMWQVNTKSGYKQTDNLVSSIPGAVRTDFGEVMRGATHTVVGGLRFSLGSARESASAGGY